MMIVRLVLAFLSTVIGIAGLVLPLLPGWLFFGVAAMLLFPDTPLARKILMRIEQRFPSTKSLLRRLFEKRSR